MFLTGVYDNKKSGLGPDFFYRVLLSDFFSSILRSRGITSFRSVLTKRLFNNSPTIIAKTEAKDHNLSGNSAASANPDAKATTDAKMSVFPLNLEKLSYLR